MCLQVQNPDQGFQTLLVPPEEAGSRHKAARAAWLQRSYREEFVQQTRRSACFGPGAVLGTRGVAPKTLAFGELSVWPGRQLQSELKSRVNKRVRRAKEKRKQGREVGRRARVGRVKCIRSSWREPAKMTRSKKVQEVQLSAGRAGQAAGTAHVKNVPKFQSYQEG